MNWLERRRLDREHRAWRRVQLGLVTVVKWLGIVLAATVVTVFIEAVLGLDSEHEPIGGLIYIVVFLALVKLRAVIHDVRPDR